MKYRNRIASLVVGASLVTAGCAGSFEQTAEALDRAEDQVAYWQGEVASANAAGDNEYLAFAADALDKAQAEVGRVSEQANAALAAGGPEDAQWAEFIGGVAAGFGGPGLLFAAIARGYANARRREEEEAKERIILSLEKSGLIANADPDTRAAIEKAQGPKVTAKVKEVIAARSSVKG
jgi:hypothetical protein